MRNSCKSVLLNTGTLEHLEWNNDIEEEGKKKKSECRKKYRGHDKKNHNGLTVINSGPPSPKGRYSLKQWMNWPNLQMKSIHYNSTWNAIIILMEVKDSFSFAIVQHTW